LKEGYFITRLQGGIEIYGVWWYAVCNPAGWMEDSTTPIAGDER